MQNSLKICSKVQESINSKDKKVFVIDSNKLNRASLRRKIFDNNCLLRVGESSYEEDFVQKISQNSPDILIFSSFKFTNKIYEQIEKIKQSDPLIKIIIITKSTDEMEFFKLVKLGIFAYCLDNYSVERLNFVIKRVVNGNHYFDDCMCNLFARLISSMSNIEYLPIDKPVDEQFGITLREQEVLLSAIKYNTYKEIGKHLFISRHTVKVHLTNVYRKFNVNNKLDAILKMLEVKFGIKI